MRILAIDTALAACSVACLDQATGAFTYQTDEIGKGHAEYLPTLVDCVMKNAGWANFNSIDRIAVTVGPGSFTGLRVGVAAARGYGLAVQCPVVGLSTLDALIEDALTGFDRTGARSDSLSDRAPVLAALDAKRGQVYLKGSEKGGVFSEPVAISLDDLEARMLGAYQVIGSGVSPLLEHDLIDKTQVLDDRGWPTIQSVAHLGTLADPKQAAKPLYLRPPDAKPQTKARITRR